VDSNGAGQTAGGCGPLTVTRELSQQNEGVRGLLSWLAKPQNQWKEGGFWGGGKQVKVEPIPGLSKTGASLKRRSGTQKVVAGHRGEQRKG